MKNLFSVFLISVSLIVTTGHAQAQKLVEIIVDNSATLRNPDQGVAAYGAIIFDLARQLSGSAGRDTIAHIVTTHNPRSIYDGDARKLSRSLTQLIVPEIQHQPKGCNQLGDAIERVRSHISRNTATEVEIYVISSLIPTGAPCKNLRVRLPQAIPANVNYQSLLQPKTTKLHFFWADRQQEAVWSQAIERSGMLERLQKQEVDYSIRGEQATRQFITDRLN